MKTGKLPVIDKDLENKAFRVFLRMLDIEDYKHSQPGEIAYRAIDYATEFSQSFATHGAVNAITRSPDSLAEYHPGAVYDSQI